MSCHPERSEDLFVRCKRRSADPPMRFETLQLHVASAGFHAIDRVPRGCGLQAVVYVIDVLHALVFQPLPESIGAVFRVHRDAFFPVARPQSTR